jgi:excisionase family DNA binding protein
MMKDNPNGIMTVEEVAELLRIPVSSVYKLAHSRKLPAQKVGRHWRFHRDTIIQWIANGQLSFSANKTNSSKLDFS